MSKIKLVVLNEHTLGYIDPRMPDYVYVLHTSILRGSNLGMNQSNYLLSKRDNVRLASVEDFDVYRVVVDGYLKDPNYLMKN